MTTISQTPIEPEVRSSKTTIFFTALALALLMVSAIGGGAAFMIYRELNAMPDPSHTASDKLPPMTRLARPAGETVADRQENMPPMTRPVVAESSDRSDYQYADNTVLPPAEARRVIAAWRSNPIYVANVPPPLVKTPAEETVAASNRPPLTDPQSHYIVDENSGRVLGIDGTAGAAADARRAQAVEIPRAVAVQTPPPEVRVASAVAVRAAIPVNPDDADAYPQDAAASGAQAVPVRRAIPVASSRSFNAASYLAQNDQDDQSAAQSAQPAGQQRRGFRLPFFGGR